MTGGFGQMLVVLEKGGIDAGPVADPMYTKNKQKLPRAGACDRRPAAAHQRRLGDDRRGGQDQGRVHPRACCAPRRRAVEFIYANPKEAAKLIAPEYNLDTETTYEILVNLINSTKSSGVPYWGTGQILYEPMNNMIKAQKDVGALSGDVDWSKIVDESFLADDLKTKK